MHLDVGCAHHQSDAGVRGFLLYLKSIFGLKFPSAKIEGPPSILGSSRNVMPSIEFTYPSMLARIDIKVILGLY